MSIFTHTEKKLKLHCLHFYIDKNKYDSKENMQNLLLGSTFLQYVAAIPMLCYYFTNKKR